MRSNRTVLRGLAELEIPDSGAWAFADDDTIVRIGHDLETEEYPV